MSKKNILFLTTPIRSHILPALYLANLLDKENNISFAVINEVSKELVERNGFKTVEQSGIRICESAESSFIIKYKKKKPTVPRILKTIIANEVFKFRKNELFNIIKTENIEIVIIDIFSSKDYLILKTFPDNLKFVFFNPMLSIYRVNGFPFVSDSFWIKETSYLSPGKKIASIVREPFQFFYDKLFTWQKRRISQLADITPKDYIDSDFTFLFKDVPELILAPLEFEINHNVSNNWQHYLGLCTFRSRIDIELSSTFEKAWTSIIKNKFNKIRTLYCSFGTFYSGSERPIYAFLEKLIKAIGDIENVQIIISASSFVIESIFKRYKIGSNIFLFTRVPQLKVLEITDVFITHGGLGSVKEAIDYEVPMLVYPVDLNYDQNGNGLKIEYHKIGIRGDFRMVDSENIKKNIIHLLSDSKYKKNISKMKSFIRREYSDSKNIQLLKSLGI